MTCREVDERIEAVAAGDEPASDAFRAHVESCLHCAAAMAAASQVEQLLATRGAGPAPAAFTTAVLGRIRRERWRSEQQVDRLFNAALAFGAMLIVGGVLALMNVSGITSALSGTIALVDEMTARFLTQAAPALSTYVLAAAFFLTTLSVWWWAERRQLL